VNVLPLDKRLSIIAMKDAGATVREIAVAVDCNRETVASYVGRVSDRRNQMRAALDSLGEEIERRLGCDALDLAGFTTLYGLLNLTCPLHPEAVMLEDVNPDTGCSMCRSDGLRRHHVRRKREGRPIVPPRRKSR
jgi:Homeodomain-like domain